MSPVLIAGAVIVSVGVVLLATILYGYLRDRSHARGSAASQRSTHKAEIGTHAKGPIARDGDSIKSGSASTASQRIAHEPTLGVAKVETPTPQLAPAVPARQVALEPALLERVLTASGPEDVSVERIAGSTGDAKPLIPAPAPKPAVPAPAEPDFTLYCPSKVLWLEGLPPSEQIQRDWPWKRTRFTRLFTIRYRGQLPEQRLLNVNGEPVDPQVTLTRVEPTADTHSKKYKTKKDPPRVYWSADGKSFDLLVNHPGVYTFRASAGIWSGDVTVEVRGLPIGVAMDGKTLIKLFGYPDDKRGYYWAYKRWPGIVISISGDPGSVSRVRWIGDDQIRKDGLPDWERAGLP